MKLNRKGFTLVELIATIVLLALVMTIAGYSVNYVIVSSKEKEYELLLSQISSAVDNYYQECRYALKNCPSDNKVSIKTLVDKGFIKANNKKDEGQEIELNNPYSAYKNEENSSILDCGIVYNWENGKMTLTNASIDITQCPTTDEYRTLKIDENR